MKLSQLHPNEGQIAGVPANPRQIRDEEFAKLKKSLTNFRKMLELRPMVVDEDFNILGGNMRYRALVQLAKEGAKIGAYQFTDDIPDEWVKQDCTLSEEQKREFVMKDNVERGEWDMDMLANEWDSEEMKKWNIDVAVWESEDNPQSKGELDVDSFDEMQELKVKFTPDEYAFVLNKLRENGKDFAQALLNILGYEH